MKIPLATSQNQKTIGLVVAGCLLVSACAGQETTGNGKVSAAVDTTTNESCILVDTDAGLDDFRAIAALAGQRRISAVVVTEGITRPAPGGMAVAHLLSTANHRNNTPIIVGASPAVPGYEDWMDEYRSNAEQLNGLLTAPVALAQTRNMNDEVRTSVQDCTTITVLMIGPWTSFSRYSNEIKDKIQAVVVQGKTLNDVPEGGKIGLNCRYDLKACKEGEQQARSIGTVTWVDIPFEKSDPYRPTPEMIWSLNTRGLPGTLRKAMETRLDQWHDAGLWDDAAAIYVVRPDLFNKVEHRASPKVPPSELRAAWIRLVNSGQ